MFLFFCPSTKGVVVVHVVHIYKLHIIKSRSPVVRVDDRFRDLNFSAVFHIEHLG